MTSPIVCAVMLTRDRPELAKRAVECYQRQTYEERMLLIYDQAYDLDKGLDWGGEAGICHAICEKQDLTIGELRNRAITKGIEQASFELGVDKPDIIVHFDDDDYSHPNRIAEQVALLQASGAECVGYNEMLFWRERDVQLSTWPGEAWLYTGTRGGVPALGTSLCYWRKTWERHHFANETQGVEDHWMREKNVVGVSSLDLRIPGTPIMQERAPRMIARIHGGNTSNGYDLEKHVANSSREWKRVLEWDARVREILK